MRLPRVRLTVRRMTVAVAVVVASLLVMRVMDVNVSLGQPPEFGWTTYPMVAVVHWANPHGSLSPRKLPPTEIRGVMLGTLVTWADGTKTLYIHR